MMSWKRIISSTVPAWSKPPARGPGERADPPQDPGGPGAGLAEDGPPRPGHRLEAALQVAQAALLHGEPLAHAHGGGGHDAGPDGRARGGRDRDPPLPAGAE